MSLAWQGLVVAGQVQAVDIRILEARQPLPGPGVTQPVVSRVMAGGGLSSLLSQPLNSPDLGTQRQETPPLSHYIFNRQ